MYRVASAIIAVLLLLGACARDGEINTDPNATSTLDIIALAAPTCAEQSGPITPLCAPRPVRAEMIVTDAAGTEVARASTRTDASLIILVVAGEYLITPQPVDGLPGTADATTVTVADGETVQVQADYDTGIR